MSNNNTSHDKSGSRFGKGTETVADKTKNAIKNAFTIQTHSQRLRQKPITSATSSPPLPPKVASPKKPSEAPPAPYDEEMNDPTGSISVVFHIFERIKPFREVFTNAHSRVCRMRKESSGWICEGQCGYYSGTVGLPELFGHFYEVLDHHCKGQGKMETKVSLTPIERLLKGLLLNPSDTDPYKSLDDIPEEEHKPLDAILEDPHKLLDAILKHWQTPDTIAASFQSTGKSGKHTGQPAIRAVIPESQDLRPILLQYTIKQAVRRIYTENAGTANRIYYILMEKFEGEWHQFERGKWSKMSATWKDEGSFISDTKPTLLILESKNSNAWAKFKEEERVRRDNQNSRKTPKGLPLNRLLPSSNHESSGYK